MKICFVVDSYFPNVGGAELFIQSLAEKLADLGHQCVVITSRKDNSSRYIEEKPNLIIVRIKVPLFMQRLWFVLMSLPKIIKFGKNCDIIHGASYGAAFPSLIAAKIMHKKIVFMVFELMGKMWKRLEPNWLVSSFYIFCENLICSSPFDRFVAISLYTRNCLRFAGVADNKIKWVYGGQVLEKFSSNDYCDMRGNLGFAVSDFIYIVYGRAGITKGMEYIIDAVPGILAKIPSAKFIFIFTKSDKRKWAYIQNKLKEFPPDVFRFICGLDRKTLCGYISQADCVVVPSLSEGFGFAALEACTLGKSIVATNAGSLPEVIFGWHILVEPASIESLVEGCNRAFLGKLVYSEPKKFDWSSSVSSIVAIYQEILS